MSANTPRPPKSENSRWAPIPLAEADLEEIGDYIALDNPRRAVSFISEIREHCEKIASGPLHYVARPELGPKLRTCSHGNYVIFFEPFKDGVLILRVLQGARNFPDILTS